MHAEFNAGFEVGKRFKDKEDMTSTILAFGKKYNVVFSTKPSHPRRGAFHFICKHGGTKRAVKDLITSAEFV